MIILEFIYKAGRIMKKMKVLVCWATFGKFYMKAIEDSEELVLAGILSNGSKNSIDIAKNLKVPLYTNINSIRGDMFDLACVVIRSTIVGGEGSKLVDSLLNKKISVIQEQPVHKNEIISNYKTAENNQVFYGLNSFYPYFDTAIRFIKIKKELLKMTKIRAIESTCSIQTLYPFLCVLSSIFEDVVPFELDKKMLNFSEYKVITGKIKGIPFIINVQNQIVPRDPDNYYNWLYKMSIITEAGNLVLTNFNGAIIWEPKIYHGKDDSGFIMTKDGKNVWSKIPVMQILSDGSQKNAYNLFYEHYPNCIKNYIDRFYNNIKEKNIDMSDINRQLNICDLWTEISHMIGAVEIINPYKIKTLIYQQDRGVFESVKE